MLAKPKTDAFLFWLATGSYLGLSPIMPGTVGSLLGLPLVLLLQRVPEAVIQALIVMGLCMGTVPVCAAVARRLGRKDPSEVVLDEIVCLPITLMAIDATWLRLAAGFVLFRVFDIVKPPPIRHLERLPQGWGIMADDFIAAIYAQVSMRLLIAAGLL